MRTLVKAFIIAPFFACSIAQAQHQMNADVMYDHFEQRVKAIASVRAISCGSVPFEADSEPANKCAHDAFATGKPFWVVYREFGIDSGIADAVVRDRKGHLYWAEGDSMGFAPPFPPHTVVEDEQHILISRCSQANRLFEVRVRPPKDMPDKAIVTCNPPVVHGPMHDDE